MELGHLPRIGLGQEGVGANQPLKDGGEDTDDALALGDLLGRGLHILSRLSMQSESKRIGGCLDFVLSQDVRRVSIDVQQSYSSGGK